MTIPSRNLGVSARSGEFYQVQDPDGTVKTFYETNPAGSRLVRRKFKQQHHPKFTKSSGMNRDWFRREQEIRQLLVESEAIAKNLEE